ncbi:MAG: tRNA pseudouridine synthase A, partial [Terriglobales bacterium]
AAPATRRRILIIPADTFGLGRDLGGQPHPAGESPAPPAQGRRLRLLLAYDGSEFHGWQVQPGLRTVQQSLTDAILTVTGESVVVHGAGRTDAGVHALGQVAHFDLAHSRIPAAALPPALNTRLPHSLRVLEAALAPPDFHARRDAVGKLYRYRLFRDPVCPPFLRNFVSHYAYPLDEAAMATAAPAFVGLHDFRSFAATPARGKAQPRGGAPGVPAPSNEARRACAQAEGRSAFQDAPASTVRRVFASGLAREGAELVYEVAGAGFLHHMVRNLVGFLLEVGRGVRSPASVAAVLAARSRAAAGPTAPPQGLYLVRVEYSGEGK